jgi:hypothetical protein
MRRLLIALLVLVALGVVLIFVARDAPDTRAYQPIVVAITNGTLVVPPTPGGEVKLSAALSGVTPRDEVIVERRPDGRLFILFPTWYGRGQDIEGWLYCSGPLKSTDFYIVDWGAGGKVDHIDVADRKMLTVISKGSTWYRVSRRLD